MVECKFTLELTKNGVQKTIYAKSGEFNSRKVVITLTESGKVFDSHLYVYRVYCQEENSTAVPKYWDEIKVVNGCIEFMLPDEWLTAGDKVCELKVYSGTESLFSPLFRIIVAQSLGGGAEAVPTGKGVRYQEALPDLPEGSAETDGEVAVYNPEENQVRRVKLGEIVVDETDPTVPAWAKQANPPSYTAEDVGALPADTFIPTKVSQLTNDSGYVSEGTVPNKAEVNDSVLKFKRDDTELFEVELPAGGGEGGNDYVLTDADKAEIAGMVKPKLHILEVVVDYGTTGIHTYDPMSLTVEADMPTNARAKRVEIPDVVNGTDELIALEDMVSKDPSYGFDAPYFIMYPKNKTGAMSKVAANVVFAFQTANSFYEAAASYAYDGKTIKIYYEIEE